MSWITLSLVSAALLGFYDLAKKEALRTNAPPAILFWSVVTSALTWLPILAATHLGYSAALPEGLRIQTDLSWHEHGLLLAKSLLVGSSWVFAYASLKHLPVSIAAPIRSTSPLWTILIAVAFMGERPSAWQWAGVAVILGSFYGLSFAGAVEGIYFLRNKWVGWMAISTFLAACSSLYDKYLLQETSLDVPTLQAWFSLYLAPVIFPLYAARHLRRRDRTALNNRWLILVIAWSLLLADFLYFTALRDPAALISVVSPLRRCAVAVSLVGGIVLFKEHGLRRKGPAVLGILAGAALLSW